MRPDELLRLFERAAIWKITRRWTAGESRVRAPELADVKA